MSSFIDPTCALVLTFTDEHHLRHVLISQIRRVYADTAASTPKRYSYDEWVYFLKLLGEDERDTTTHKHASELEDRTSGHGNNPARKNTIDLCGQEGAYGRGSDKAPGQDKNKVSWSWIGNRSPLMGDKEEAEWLLEKLFERLEESLRSELKETELGVENEKEGINPRKTERDGDEDDGSGSDQTITRCRESIQRREEQDKTDPVPSDLVQ